MRVDNIVLYQIIKPILRKQRDRRRKTQRRTDDAGHIGKNSVIGAGSIVTRDIPENVLAVGSPCHVVREIGARDREFYSHWDDRIDWDNLKGICEAKSSLPIFN